MQDEESKFLFEKKVESVVVKDPSIFQLALMEIEKEWKDPDIDELNNENNINKGIYIWGTGQRGVATYLLLRELGMDYRVLAFIDNDSLKWGETLYGKKVITPYDPNLLNGDLILISANRNSAGSIYAQLMGMYDIERQNIFYPRPGFLQASSGWQYFDVFQPNKSEFFIDAGAYNGDSSVEFVKWAGNDYLGIYAFEPFLDLEKLYCSTIETRKICHTKFFRKGLWEKSGKLTFCEHGASSKIDTNGKSVIDVIALDDIDENSPTFIKMDIEGAELSALKGAQHTIEKYHPRLAICIYHKQEDIISIPNYILEIDSDYHFYIRCYNSSGSELVLYAE